ncbi:MAG: hypothetical protein Q7T16_04755 [Candidatus Burarchaeum sp.]|nr:hypothetical protein [Candidatus Burarchaeum sp.]MDO8339939.1 hypothetical protein [Candidatus Burarchaeum sp.]
MMRVAVVSFVAILFFAGTSFAASVPSWVQPGVTANYEVISSFYENDQPVENGGAQGTVEISVSQVSGNAVTGTATANIPAAMKTDTYDLNCVEGSKCDWRFWVDPSDPTNSATGPNGEKLEVLGRGPFEYYGGETVPDATMIGYSNEQTGISYRYTFDSRTGLVYAYVEDFPTQKTYMYYRSISADLSAYQPPAGIPQTPAAPTGQQTGIPGQQTPASGQQTGIPGQQQTPTTGQQGAVATQGTDAQQGTTGATAGQPAQDGGATAAQKGSLCPVAAALLLLAGFAYFRNAQR